MLIHSPDAPRTAWTSAVNVTLLFMFLTHIKMLPLQETTAPLYQRYRACVRRLTFPPTTGGGGGSAKSTYGGGGQPKVHHAYEGGGGGSKTADFLRTYLLHRPWPSIKLVLKT